MKKHIFIITLLLSFSLFGWADAEILAQGQLKAYSSSPFSPSLHGDWKIVDEGGATYLELGENFKTSKGPDVMIYLSPMSADEITKDNATSGATKIKLLDKFKGAEKIELSGISGEDIANFKSIVFYCKEYSKMWGTSPIR
ncbi:MAG: hypothetical protein ACJA04_000943 [Cellvibrionaceae bacterium]|jgi:hypothetical protein